MTTQFCVANLYTVNDSTGSKVLRGYAFYGARGAKQSDGTYSSDAYDTSLTTSVTSSGLKATWLDPITKNLETLDMTGINIPEWLADTKTNGTRPDSKRPNEVYSKPRVIDGFSVKLIWNSVMSEILSHNKKHPKAPKPLPKDAKDHWTTRFLVNPSYSILTEGEEFADDDGWF